MQNSRWRSSCCGVLAASALLVSGLPAGAQTATATQRSPLRPVAAQRTFLAPQLPQSVQRSTQGVIFGDVIGRTIGDFKRLPSRDTLALLGIGAVIALSAHPADRATSSSLSGSSALDAPFEAGEVVGGALFQLVGSAATYLTGRATGSERVIAVGADLLRAQILAQTVTAAIKHAARRQRPDGTMYSFPSGHSSVSFASATVVQRHYGWKAGALAYGLATYVAASRIQEARHFLSDVAFGAAIGIAAGRTVTIGLGENRFAVAPTVSRGGAGVNFSLVSN